MKPVPVSSVERVRCQYAGDGDRKARRVSRGAGAEMKKNAASKTKNRHFTNRRRHRFSPAFALKKRKKRPRGRFLFSFSRDFSNLVWSVSAAHAQSRVSRNPGIDVETRANVGNRGTALFAQTLVLERMMWMCGARDPSVRGACGAGSRGSSARGARPEPPRTFGVDRRERVAQLLRRRERTPRLRGFRSESQTRPRGVLQARVGQFLRVEVREERARRRVRARGCHHGRARGDHRGR